MAAAAAPLLVPPQVDVLLAHYLTIAAFTALWAIVGAVFLLLLPRLRSRGLHAVAQGFLVGTERTNVLRDCV